MRKIIIACVTLLILCTFASPASALKFNVKIGFNDVLGTWTTCRGNKLEIKIYLEDWDDHWFSSEPLFGVQMFLYYDRNYFQPNLANSYPNDTDHGGQFDPETSYVQSLNGKLKLVASNPNCVGIWSRKLLWTVELEVISFGWTDIYVQTDYPNDGLVAAGGPSCASPHPVTANDATVNFLIKSLDANGNGCVDACECEGDFDGDGSVNSQDVTAFLVHFGRNYYNNPCRTQAPCNGDFFCDGSVDARDMTVFLADFGRNLYSNPCPEGCYTNPWCDY